MAVARDKSGIVRIYEFMLALNNEIKMNIAH